MALEANSWPAYLVQNSLNFGKISKVTNSNKAQYSVVRPAGGNAIYVRNPVICYFRIRAGAANVGWPPFATDAAHLTNSQFGLDAVIRWFWSGIDALERGSRSGVRTKRPLDFFRSIGAVIQLARCAAYLSLGVVASPPKFGPTAKSHSINAATGARGFHGGVTMKY